MYSNSKFNNMSRGIGSEVVEEFSTESDHDDDDEKTEDLAVLSPIATRAASLDLGRNFFSTILWIPLRYMDKTF